MLPDVLKNPQNLNLVFSTTILLFGLIIYWYHPDVFHQHGFVERTFEFWVLKWMAFVITWGLITTTTDLKFALAAVDLNSIFGIGLVVALWSGDDYDERHTIINLVFLFGLLFAWNFSIQAIFGPGKAWVFPSMTMSLIVIFAMGFTMVARYGAPGIAFAIISAAYLLLQLPTYQILFIKRISADPELIKWLAFAKMLYATVFYVVFFSPIQHFKPIRMPSLPIPSEKTRRVLTYLGGAIGGGILTELVLWLSKHAWQVVTGHPVGG